MKLVIQGMLLFLTFSPVSTFAAGTSYPLSCISFDPAQLTVVPQDDTRQVVSGQIPVFTADGTWGDVDSGTYNPTKTAADNQELAQQISALLQDYGINSHCVNLSGYDGTPAAAAPDYNGFLKDGALPSGTSPHDGNCIRFVAKNLMVDQVYRSGDDLTVEIDELMDPATQTLLFSTWEGTGAAFRQFLVDQNAARFCTVSIDDPNFFIDSTFTYFTR